MSGENTHGTDIVYDWNHHGRHRATVRQVELHDETLRDGIQCPSVTDPPLEVKKQVVRHLASLGVASVNVGLPGAGPRAVADCVELVELIRDEKLPIRAGCAARTIATDIDPIVEISQKTGMPVEVMTFLGSSPIRMLAESWEESRLEKLTRDAVRIGVKAGIPVSFVTEDTVRSHPTTLRRVFDAAVEEGADRLVLCDTVGHVTPEGTHNLVEWVDAHLRGLGVRDRVRVDWHGHQDRGLSLANAMAAIEAGCDRVHGCILGIGERVGNTPLDQLLVNLKLMGAEERDLTELAALVDLVGEHCGVPIPVSYPVFGKDAFRTGTGVHAAAVIKAQAKGDDWLADRIYSGVPASWFGRFQQIEIGHQSGLSNVRYWLKSRGIADDDGLAQAIFEAAKQTDRLLSDGEVMCIVEQHRGISRP
ncbi:MAG: 2-isopropylmalate synthase [Myxococcales bacterium]|nr:2-isopropylmalate synthase [Myxococcales bacterium]